MSEEECSKYCTHDSYTVLCSQSCIIDWLCNIISSSRYSRDLISVPCACLTVSSSVCAYNNLSYLA